MVKNSINLPKLETRQFKGNAANWQTFSESFNETIDKNPSFPDIEKLNYLNSLLTNEAFSCVEGLKLSNENCKVTKDMLAKRFGDPQALISDTWKNVYVWMLLKTTKTRRTSVIYLTPLKHKCEV